MKINRRSEMTVGIGERWSERIKHGEAASGLLLIMPVIIVFLIVRVIPSAWAFYISFTDFTVVRGSVWRGLGNYRDLLADRLFIRAIYNTFIYAIATTVLSTALALAIALALDRKFRGASILKIAYFTPVVISVVAVSSIWIYILNPQFGVLNYLLSFIGVPKQAWLFDTRLAMPTLIFVGVWQCVGYNTMIYLAGLQSIPDHLREAAIVDGATGFRQFRRITWPLLMPTTMLILILTGLATFQAFDQVIVLTDGGPANSTTTVVHQIYRNAFLYLKMGKAAAMSFVLFLGLLILSLLALRLGRREIRY